MQLSALSSGPVSVPVWDSSATDPVNQFALRSRGEQHALFVLCHQSMRLLLRVRSWRDLIECGGGGGERGDGVGRDGAEASRSDIESALAGGRRCRSCRRCPRA